MNSPSKKIDITLEELSREPTTTRIDITADELKELPLADYGPIKEKALKESLNVSSLLQKGVVAGVIGGVVAWLLAEAGTLLAGEQSTPALMLFQMGIFGAIIGTPISVALAVGDWLYSSLGKKSGRAILTATGIGLGGGFAGGVVAQLVYGLLGGGATSTFALQVAARSIGWGLIGLFIGLSQGLIVPTRKRIYNSLLGGAAGGAVGGFLFDPISSVLGGGGVISRGVAIIVLGACTGFAINLVEQVAKEAWLQAIKGAFEGKEYIIYENTTILGSGKGCSITLFKDQGVSSQHAEIRVEGGSYCIYDRGSATGTLVNGAAIRRKALRNGDVIKLGEAALLFREKSKARA